MVNLLGLVCFVAGDLVRAGGVAVAAPPPSSLTASDGAGLELVSLAAQAVIDDPLAFTELHLVFRNPESRVREGRFRITLPSGATVSRFAMRVGDRWQEGEVVEQQAARVAYEDFLHRRQDPALLEAEAGNEFSARVFPIPPGATKELIISYSQELKAAGEPYRLPLVGLPQLGDAVDPRPRQQARRRAATGPASSLGGQRARTETVEVHKRSSSRIGLRGRSAAARLGLRNDNLVVARIVPFADAARRDEVASLFVLVDTSASRALGLADEVAAVERLLAALRKAGDPNVSRRRLRSGRRPPLRRQGQRARFGAAQAASPPAGPRGLRPRTRPRLGRGRPSKDRRRASCWSPTASPPPARPPPTSCARA